MADISVKCRECGATLMVSEYVDADALKCRACGGQMQKPGEAPAAVAPAIRLARAKPAAAPPEVEAPRPEAAAGSEAAERLRKVRSFFPNRLNRKPVARARGGKKGGVSALRYWVLFGIMAVAATGLRYGGILSDPADLEMVINGALIFMGIVHLTVLAQAFHEDVFQGVLCLFVPFYSVYYLVTQSDSMALRSVGGAVLLAFAVDLSAFLVRSAVWFYDFINHWIFNMSVA